MQRVDKKQQFAAVIAAVDDFDGAAGEFEAQCPVQSGGRQVRIDVADPGQAGGGARGERPAWQQGPLDAADTAWAIAGQQLAIAPILVLFHRYGRAATGVVAGVDVPGLGAKSIGLKVLPIWAVVSPVQKPSR